MALQCGIVGLPNVGTGGKLPFLYDRTERGCNYCT